MTNKVRRRLLLLAIPLGLLLCASVAFYLVFLLDLPSPDNLAGRAAAPSNKVYDRNGRLLYEMPPVGGGSHSPVAWDQMPPVLLQATIAVEDASFYENPGVDPLGIVRALWINLRGGAAGGSTITQQLVRTVLLDPEERAERTLRRKVREAVLAWRLTRRYSKDEILTLYLNETYYGNMAYGAEAAAQAYFDKHVADLDLAECALLAGLVQAPSAYNPLENMEAAQSRQAIVLDLMVKQGYISAEQARQAKEEKLYFAAAPFAIRAPHFVMYVRALLEDQIGLERLEQGGLNIHTTLDLDLNETARDIARYRLSRLADCNGRREQCPPGGHNVRNAALVAISPQTGEILAMLGSPDYFSAQIDGAVNATTALRQPGSSIKPITYAAAFEQGTLTPATMLWDLRTAFVTAEGTPYVPYNYDLQFRGPVRLREALGSSYNLIAVKLLDAIGIPAMTSMARRLGISTLDRPNFGLAVTLGGGEVRLLELTAAFASLANGGQIVRPVAVLRVEDSGGHLVWESAPGLGGQVLDRRVAYLVSDILSDDTARIPSFGEGSVLQLTRPAAVKTGTTYDFHDNWTVGYTPDLAVGVWAGNADNEAMFQVSGISGAAPIWHDFMETALKGHAERTFERPAGLVEVEVCALSGLLPNPDCPHRVTELVLSGSEPRETCAMHQRIAVDVATGLRATAATPAERVVERIFTVVPPEGAEWARLQGIPQPPPALIVEAAAATGSSDAAPALVMTAPDQGASYQISPVLARDAQRILVAVRPGAGTALRQLTLYADGRPLATFVVPPYRTYWTLEPGTHTFWAEALDDQGQSVHSAVVSLEVLQ